MTETDGAVGCTVDVVLPTTIEPWGSVVVYWTMETDGDVGGAGSAGLYNVVSEEGVAIAIGIDDTVVVTTTEP